MEVCIMHKIDENYEKLNHILGINSLDDLKIKESNLDDFLLYALYRIPSYIGVTQIKIDNKNKCCFVMYFEIPSTCFALTDGIVNKEVYRIGKCLHENIQVYKEGNCFYRNDCLECNEYWFIDSSG